MLNEHLNTFLVGTNLKLLSQKPVPEGFLWEVEKIGSEQACLRCGSIKTVRAGKCTTLVREEPVRQMSLWLKIHKHRIYCKDVALYGLLKKIRFTTHQPFLTMNYN